VSGPIRIWEGRGWLAHPKILSEVTASRSEAVTQSKDLLSRASSQSLKGYSHLI